MKLPILKSLLSLTALLALPCAAVGQLAPLSVQAHESDPETGGDLGWSVAAGDIDGDGYDDAVIGAPHRDVGLLIDAGRVLVRFGPAFVSEQTITAPVPVASADFGLDVACADVNGDGFADVVVGAPDEAVSGMTDVGRVYLFLGPDLVTVIALDMPAPTASADFGTSVAIGDVTGDGMPDIVVGAPEARVGGVLAGTVYVFDGPTSSLLATLPHPTPAVGNQFGWDVAVGDTSGNGVGDVIVGIPNMTAGGLVEAGAVEVYFGPGLTTSALLTEPAPERSAEFGRSVAAGDVNGDGFADVAAGIPDARPAGVVDAGEAVLLFGPGFTTSMVLNEPVIEWRADFGWDVAIGDADGDGFADLMIGAQDATSDAEIDAGRAYLFHGPALTTVTEFLPDPIHNDDDFGYSLAFGDFNDDGLLDALVGAKDGEVTTIFDQGRAFALLWQDDLALSGVTLSASLGGTITWFLAAGLANALDRYALLGSTLGNSPCLSFPQICVPIAMDPLLTMFLLSTVPGAMGTFDAGGSGAAFLPIPPGVLPPALVGFQFTWAYLNLDTKAYASHSVVFEITP